MMKRLRERARVLADVRRFFDARGFLEVQTPDRRPLPGLDLHLDAFEVAGGRARCGSLAHHVARVPDEAPPRRGLRRASTRSRVLPARRGRCAAQPGVHDARVVPRERGRRRGDARHRAARRAPSRAARCAWATRTVDVRPPFERLTVCDAFARFARLDEHEATLTRRPRDEDRYFRAARRRGRAGARGARSRGVSWSTSRRRRPRSRGRSPATRASRSDSSSTWPASSCATASASSSTRSSSGRVSSTTRTRGKSADCPCTRSTSASSRRSSEDAAERRQRARPRSPRRARLRDDRIADVLAFTADEL